SQLRANNAQASDASNQDRGIDSADLNRPRLESRHSFPSGGHAAILHTRREETVNTFQRVPLEERSRHTWPQYQVCVWPKRASDRNAPGKYVRCAPLWEDPIYN